MKSPPAGQDDGGGGPRAKSPPSGGARHGKGLPFFVGQSIRDVEVVGVWKKTGAMLHLPGPRKWTNNWLRSGAQLSVGDNLDVRVKSVDGPNKRVIVTLLEANAVDDGNASQAIDGLMIGTMRPGWFGCGIWVLGVLYFFQFVGSSPFGVLVPSCGLFVSPSDVV